MSELQEKYFSHIKTQKLKNFIDAVVCNNQQDAADQLEVSRRTVRRWKNKWDDMDRQEREQLMLDLLQYEEEDEV